MERRVLDCQKRERETIVTLARSSALYGGGGEFQWSKASVGDGWWSLAPAGE